LSRFGEALQQLPPSPLADELAAALAGSTHALANDLRAELATWDSLLGDLNKLAQSRYLPREIDVVAINDQLVLARAAASQILDVLEGLNSENGTRTAELLAAPTPSPSPPRSGEGRSLLHKARSTTAPQLEEGSRESDIKLTPSQSTLRLTTPPLSQLCGRGAGGEGADRDLPNTLTPNSSPAKPREGDNKPAPPPPRKLANQLSMRCPCCGESGRVSWDRLNQIQNCRNCGRHFAVRADGSPIEVVKAKGDRWRPRDKASSQSRSPAHRRILVASLAALLAAPLLGVAGWRIARPASAAAVEAELPRELSPRAETFARAWLGGDVRTMKRLTSPAQDRVLYGWFTRHRPPALAAVSSESPRVEVALQSTKADQAVLRVRLTGAAPVEMTQTWERRGDTWFFLPPAK
jgi:hypothetical protein